MVKEKFEAELRRKLLRTDATRAVITLSITYDEDVFDVFGDDEEDFEEYFEEYYGLSVSFNTVIAAIAGDEEARKKVRRGKLLGIFDYQTMHFLELTQDFRLVPSDFSDFAYRLYIARATAVENVEGFCLVTISFEVNSKVVEEVM